MAGFKNVVILGGGPAGLFLARLLRLDDPACEVHVHERNPADATYGFGVVFSPQTLSGFEAADGATHDSIVDASVEWSSSELHHEGRVVQWRGFGFAGISRATLLQVLQRQAAAAGAQLHFNSEIGPADLVRFENADVIAVCDGANSAARESRRQAFKPELILAESKYIWCGSEVPLKVGSFFLKRSEHGPFAIHSYPYSESMSTIVVETDDTTWRSAGLHRPANDLSAPGANDEKSLRYLELLFAPELQGHRLHGNKSVWDQFRTLRNQHWSSGNLVLLGDAAHTAGPSVGSGTKMAMEDAIFLAACLREETAVSAAFERFEQGRRPLVERIQTRSLPSQDWWSTFGKRLDRGPEDLAFHYLTRTGAVTYSGTAAKDPEFAALVVDSFRADAFPGRHEQCPPNWSPLTTALRLNEVDLPGRFVLSLPLSGSLSRDNLLALCDTARRSHWDPALIMFELGSEADTQDGGVDLIRGAAVAAETLGYRLGLRVRPDASISAVQTAADAGFDVIDLDRPGTVDEALRWLTTVAKVWPAGKATGVTLSLVDDEDAFRHWLKAIDGRGFDLVTAADATPSVAELARLRDLPAGARTADLVHEVTAAAVGLIVKTDVDPESVSTAVLSRRVDLVEVRSGSLTGVGLRISSANVPAEEARRARIGGPGDEGQVVRMPEAFAERYRIAGVWPRTTVGAAFHESAVRYGAKAAVVSADSRTTYAQLDADSDRLGAALLQLGLEQGDRVLFQTGNVIETVVAYYGVLKAGLVPVCSIPQHGEHEMSYLAKHTGARAYIVQSDYRSQDLTALASLVAASHSSIEILISLRGRVDGFTSLEQLIESQDGASARRQLEGLHIEPEDVAVFQLSGGTTGVPKVIPRMHTEYVYNSLALAAAWGWDESLVLMHPLPLMHNAGTVAALQPTHLVGGTFVLPESAVPEAYLPLIEQERVTDVPVVPPAILIRLLDSPDRHRFDLSSLQRFVVAGQKLSPEFADRMESDLGLRCLQLFGMAEGLITRTPTDAPEWVRKHTVGVPISPFDEVRVLEPHSEVEVSLGEMGELCSRGPYTIRGYYDAAQHNASAFTSDGFYRTGDLAQLHEVDGRTYLSIEGRIKDVINRGAEKISAEEVEGVIGAHPAVHSAAIAAMPDRVLGERACAFLIMEDGQAPISLAELQAFLLGRGLAKFKLPERLKIVEGFPLTNVGKVSKKHLREEVARDMGTVAAGGSATP